MSFGKFYQLGNKIEECVDLLQQFIALLQFLSTVFQHGAGTVVLPLPLLVGFLLQVDVSEAQRPQPCKGATIQRAILIGTIQHVYRYCAVRDKKNIN